MYPYDSGVLLVFFTRTCMYPYVPVCTRLYSYVPVCTLINPNVVVCTRMYPFVFVCSRVYSFVLVFSRMYPVCIRVFVRHSLYPCVLFFHNVKIVILGYAPTDT